MASYDIVAVGAGMSGLNLIYQARQLGLSIRVLEQANDVGGTWFWNRYPGARCDIPARDYQFTIAPEVMKEWRWSRRYPAQPELLKYFGWVADRLDLRKDISFNQQVKTAVWDNAAGRWSVVTEDGTQLQAKHLVFASGCLSVPLQPHINGLNDTFKGKIYYTNQWPKEDVLPSFAGKKVAIIGVGSSGAQALTPIAAIAKEVTAFQRTANFVLPASDREVTEEEAAADQAELVERRTLLEATPFGLDTAVHPEPIMSLAEDVFQDRMEKAFAMGGFGGVFGVGCDLPLSAEGNARVSAWIRERMGSQIKNEEKRKLVTSFDFPAFSKRIIVCDNYLRSVDRDNVTLVDISPKTGSSISHITENAVVLANGKHFKADIIVMATGFDAMTGALVKPDIRGRDGVSLRETWKDGPVCWAGLAINGFPNFWTITGPLSPSVLSNMALATHQAVTWVARAIDKMVQSNSVAEVTAQAQAEWVGFQNAIAGMLCTCNGPSWYRGINVPGKPAVFMVFPGGLQLYGAKIGEMAQDNAYPGFLLTAAC